MEAFEEHPVRGRFNSAFFWLMGGYLNSHMRHRKSSAFADLPPTVVELGAGVGANLRYLPSGAHLIAIERDNQLWLTAMVEDVDGNVFLDFTGGVKPYLLHEMGNHLGLLHRDERMAWKGRDDGRP